MGEAKDTCSADDKPLVDRRGTIETKPSVIAMPPEELRTTVAAPAIIKALANLTAPDPIAAARGVRPITAPYVRTAASRSGRGIVVASVTVAGVSLLIAVAAVLWAVSS